MSTGHEIAGAAGRKDLPRALAARSGRPLDRSDVGFCVGIFGRRYDAAIGATMRPATRRTPGMKNGEDADASARALGD